MNVRHVHLNKKEEILSWWIDRSGVLVVDDFLKDPGSRRHFAVSHSFQTEIATGVEYPGIARIDNIHLVNEDLEWVAAPQMKSLVNFFRLTLDKDVMPTYIHNDLAMASVTGILYLNDPSQCSGGTAFWKHKATGSVDSNAITSDNLTSFQSDGLDENRWDLEALVEMKFNRLVLFNSDLWHSAYPRHGFGSTPEDGRLIQAYFMSEVFNDT